MNLKEIDELIRSGRFISGVYNYCDRWCERCRFTSRCLLFMQDQEDDDPVTDIGDEAFWEKLKSRLENTKQLILEAAKEEGLGPEVLQREAAQAPPRPPIDPYSHELSRSALEYAEMANAWFDQEPNAVGNAFEPTEPANDMEDSVEVIRWFQYQIGVKVAVASHSRLYRDEDEDEDPQLPGEQPDSDGRVKVALIGLDRSIAAWRVLSGCFPSKSETIRPILLHLEALRAKTEAAFPHARNFPRPGFDFTLEIQ